MKEEEEMEEKKKKKKISTVNSTHLFLKFKILPERHKKEDMGIGKH